MFIFLISLSFFLANAVDFSDVVDKINSMNTTFWARNYPEFTNLTSDQLRQFFGTSDKQKRFGVFKSATRKDVFSDIPSEFNVSEKWPHCQQVFEDIEVQGNCSSSWAISVTSSIRDRRCIQLGYTESVSAYDLLSCCDDCQLVNGNGCNGGDHSEAFKYLIKSGIVTGGTYGSSEGCKPYKIRPQMDLPKPNSTQCVKKCQSDYGTAYKDDKIKGAEMLTFSLSTDRVKREIMANGPLVAEFILYQDFLAYSGGIYQHSTGDRLGFYYAKILGWGSQSDKGMYWIASASFGSNWGESGTFRIMLGDQSKTDFEARIVGIKTILGNSKKTTPTVQPKTLATVPPPAKIKCRTISAFYKGQFTYTFSSDKTFNASFQLLLNADVLTQQLSLKVINQTVSKADGGTIIVKIGDDTECYPPDWKGCSVPFSSTKQFEVRVTTHTADWWPYLINYVDFDNMFSMDNAIGGCGKQLKNNNPDNLDTSLYQQCYCCSDDYNPHPALGCPV